MSALYKTAKTILEKRPYGTLVLIPLAVYIVMGLFYYVIFPINQFLGMDYSNVEEILEDLFMISTHILFLSIVVISGVGLIILKKKGHISLWRSALESFGFSLYASVAYGFILIILPVIKHLIVSKYYADSTMGGEIAALMFLLPVILYFFLSTFLILLLVNCIWHYKLK